MDRYQITDILKGLAYNQAVKPLRHFQNAVNADKIGTKAAVIAKISLLILALQCWVNYSNKLLALIKEVPDYGSTNKR